MSLRLIYFIIVASLTSTLNAEEKPNIVLIMMDEWGYFESSGMGHPILETPNIDRFAAEGMRFTQFLAGGNVCAPTRSTLMTGQHTGHTTVRGNGGGAALRTDDRTVADVLHDLGYATGGFGKWGLGDVGTTGVPELHGFDTFFGYYHQVHAHNHFPRVLIRNSKKVPLEGNSGNIYSGNHFAQTLIHKAGLEFIREHQNQPFFAYMPWTPPHGHWGIPEDEPAWIKYREAQWDAGQQRRAEDARIYAAMVEMVDRQIGEVMQLLKELELDEKTIVIVCGDNGGQSYFKTQDRPHGFFAPNLNPRTGERFRGGKREFYEGGLRIPFLVRWPGKIAAGSVSDHLGYFPDVLPTVNELAGGEVVAGIDGISIVPTLLGEDVAARSQREHEYLYWEDANATAIRMGNWKAVRPGRTAPYELYDLTSDLQEQHNIAVNHPDILARLLGFAKQAHSPPRHGRVLDPKVGFNRNTH